MDASASGSVPDAGRNILDCGLCLKVDFACPGHAGVLAPHPAKACGATVARLASRGRLAGTRARQDSVPSLPDGFPCRRSACRACRLQLKAARRRLSGEGCPGSGPAWPGGARGSFLAGEGDAGGRPLASNHAKKDRRFGTGRERQEYERKCMAFPAACMHRRRIRSSWQGLGHAGMRSCGVGGAGLLSSPGAARSRLKAPPVALARKRAALPPVHSCAGEDAP